MRRNKIVLAAAMFAELVMILTFAVSDSTKAGNTEMEKSEVTVSMEAETSGAIVSAVANIDIELPEPVVKCNVTAVLYGETVTFEIETGTSVADALNMIGVVPETNDSVTPELSETIESDMTITVSRTEYTFETVETEIPAAVRYVNSPYLAEGEQVVIKEGHSGKTASVYRCTYIDGELDSREQESENEVISAGETIISVGTRTSASHSYTAPEGYTGGSDGVVTTLNGTTLNYTRTLNMRATAYTYNNFPGSTNITSSGQPVRVGLVAALPSTLPQGTLVYIAADDGSWEYGIAEVADRPGMDIIDLFMEDYNECIEFGARNCVVYVLDE